MKYFGLTALLSLLICSSVFAQRANYASLANRSVAPKFFIDQVIIPSSENGKAEFGIIFKMENNFIPFKKLGFNEDFKAPNEEEFYSIIRLNSEIFKGKFERRATTSESASRDLWQDTVFAATFSDTESQLLYQDGMLTSTLSAGAYNFVLQLSMQNQASERNSSRQNFMIPDFELKPRGEIHLISSEINEIDNTIQLPLLNLGNNIVFGKDFYAFIRVPNYESDNSYSLKFSEVRLGEKDTTNIKSIYEYDLVESDFHTSVQLKLEDPQNPSISVQKNEGSNHTYALVNIPNSTFENSAYRIELFDKADPEKALAQRVVQSYWADMPPALFSLDMSINMLKFVVTEDQLKEMRRGSATEKEKKLRAFWKEKDPTPNTVFNELMTEYYRRVDYAFKTYTTPQTQNGFDTDQGKVYIQYGPPSSQSRSFPERGKAIETWVYPNRTFVFEKGAGYSEFQLIASE